MAEVEGRAVGFMLLEFTSVWGHRGNHLKRRLSVSTGLMSLQGSKERAWDENYSLRQRKELKNAELG
ncbi:MAG: hypothetical protein QXF52_11065 [Thermoproteota archaeon]